MIVLTMMKDLAIVRLLEVYIHCISSCTLINVLGHIVQAMAFCAMLWFQTGAVCGPLPVQSIGMWHIYNASRSKIRNDTT